MSKTGRDKLRIEGVTRYSGTFIISDTSKTKQDKGIPDRLKDRVSGALHKQFIYLFSDYLIYFFTNHFLIYSFIYQGYVP